VFSTRLPWERPENALAQVERDRRASGLPLIDLTESNPTRVGLVYPEAALRDALGAVAAERYDPAPLGLRAAREAIAADYNATGLAVDAERVVLTASSSESYALLFKLLCDPGDAILVPEPSYPLFEYLAALEGVRAIGYRLIYDGDWHIDFDSLAAACARANTNPSSAGRARALVVVNPNNPTGSFVSDGDLARVAEVCAAADLAVISDEVFSPYRFAAGADADAERGATPACLAEAPMLGERTLIFSLGGLSKACGLPQLKLGWMIAGGPAPAVRAALTRLDLIADTYLSVAGPVQRALPRLLVIGEAIRARILDRVRHNRGALRAAIAPGSPCTLLDAQGGWSAIIRVPDVPDKMAGAADDVVDAFRAGGAERPNDERWAMALLRRDGVLIHPGYLFDMPPGAYLVASLLPSPEFFLSGARAVVARCADSVP
jgi:alanine-synthesizing transaminase